MESSKKKRLEKAGWKVGSTADFLDLSPEEVRIVELRLALADCLREVRTKKRLTQEGLAKRIHSSQSRVAKMEAGDQSVSLDLLFRSLFTLGVSRAQLARAVKV
jgi:DNA-binding XRE family transcriptional regulator